MDNTNNMMPPEGMNNMVSGKWIDKRTGAVVNVRDSIIDGDNMIIITDRGHIPMMEFSDNYIQASEDLYDDKGNIIGKQEISSNEFQPVITPQKLKDIQKAKDDFNNEFISIDEFVNNENNIKNEIEQKASTVTIIQTPIEEHTENKQQIKNIDIIDKVFTKIKSKPELTVNIEWEDFPSEQINTLINYLDIDINDIASYILNKYMDNNIIVNCIKKKIIM